MRLGQDSITSLFPKLAKIPDLKKISIEFTNNSSTTQPINILETFLNQSAPSGSVVYKMNGSEANYNYLLNDIIFNPLLCFLIYLRTNSIAQISNSMNLEISQATGQTFIDTKYPDAFLDINQTFANIVMVPMNFVFDGADYIANYILNAGVTVSMILYVKQFKRSRMMQPNWLKRNNFGAYLDFSNKKNVIFEQQSSPVLPSVEHPPVELLDGEDNNQLAEEEFLGFDGSVPYRRSLSW